MAETASLLEQIDPSLKEQSESILTESSIQMPEHGIPFAIRHRAQNPLDLNALTQEQRNAELQKGYDDVLAGRTKSADQVFDAIWREYGVERV